MVNALKQMYKNSSVVHKSNRQSLVLKELDFKKIMQYERIRTDREKNNFSLLMFEIDQDSPLVNELLGELQHKISKIDIIGWFNENHLCVLMPLTNYEGAIEVHKKIYQNLFFQIINIKCKVYTYPDHWIKTEDMAELKKIAKISQEQEKIHQNNNESSARSITDLNEPIHHEIVEAFVKRIPVWKRIMDIALSLTGLLFLSPLFLLTALYIKIVSKGPVFYKQKRIGYKRRVFDFYKFRSMHVDNNNSGHQNYLSELIKSDKPMIKLDQKKDSRIIKGGEILRKTCIDELPQLINVLKGDMSLVGPRPCLPYEEKEYVQWYRNRFDILPGMTGLWQVSGKNQLTFKQMIRLDIAYTKNLSLINDLKILVMTVPTIIGLILEKKIKKSKEVK
ncbi:MAG: sugar transferase [Spirochaetes bacterium]|nr:sugar transferase [Spirochaetota bacterium]